MQRTFGVLTLAVAAGLCCAAAQAATLKLGVKTDALTLDPIWSSTSAPADDIGFYAKFSVATVADGKVFVDSWGDTHDGGVVHVYGLRCDPACAPGQQCVNGTCESCTPQQINNNCGDHCSAAACGGSCQCSVDQECLNGSCRACTPQEIENNCKGACSGPDGCGGVCQCKPGYHCATEDGPPIIMSGLHPRPAGVPYIKPPPPPPVCVCDGDTIKRNCDGKCNVSDGCGGICACSAGLACNPQTATCCDWQTECARVGACSTVCGGVQCSCSGRCIEGKCCASQCNDSSQCGTPDGCGGGCNGKCPPQKVCIADNGRFYCDPIPKVCAVKPWVCSPNAELTEGTRDRPPAVIQHPDVQYLLSTCKRDPKACELDKTHHAGHL